ADMQAVASGGTGSFYCELLTDWPYTPGPHGLLNGGPIPDGIATKAQSVPQQTYPVVQTTTLDCFNASQVPITLSQLRSMAVLTKCGTVWRSSRNHLIECVVPLFF